MQLTTNELIEKALELSGCDKARDNVGQLLQCVKGIECSRQEICARFYLVKVKDNLLRGLNNG